MNLTNILRMRWSRIISEAEKLVGYTNSFMSLQDVLTDEMAQVALSFRKLMNTKHPLFKTAKHLIYDGSNAIQTWGLTVLLISRAANYSLIGKTPDFPADEIFPAQRNLAETVELICTANLIHRGILNVDEMQNGEKQNLILGNKLGVLSGDYLLASASVALAKLRNPKVVSDIAQAIADMTQSEFVNELKNTNDLERKIYLSSGSLLAYGCRSSLELAKHNEEYKSSAFEFGKNLSTTFAIHKALSKSNEANDMSPFSVNLFSNLNVEQIQMVDLLQHYGNNALHNLKTYPNSDAKKSLENMTKALISLR